MTREIRISNSLAQTWELAAALVQRLRDAAISRPVTLALHGELGAGKTAFTQGIARALGIRRPVTSPTFTVVNEYPGHPPLYHIDLYRLSGPDEALALGFEDYLEMPGFTVIEWPDRAAGLLPDNTVHIRIEHTADSGHRRIVIEHPSGAIDAAFGLT